MRIKTLGITAMLVTIILSLSGCAMWRAVNPFDAVSVKDLEGEGTKIRTISVGSIIGGAIDPRLELASGLLSALGQGDPLGVILVAAVPGEDAPRHLLCKDKAIALKCVALPANARINYAGRLIGDGFLTELRMLTSPDFND